MKQDPGGQSGLRGRADPRSRHLSGETLRGGFRVGNQELGLWPPGFQVQQLVRFRHIGSQAPPKPTGTRPRFLNCGVLANRTGFSICVWPAPPLASNLDASRRVPVAGCGHLVLLGVGLTGRPRLAIQVRELRQSRGESTESERPSREPSPQDLLPTDT